MKDFRHILTRVLIVLACASSLLPYLLVGYVGDWSTEALGFTGSGIWLTLVLATLVSGKWERKLWWLFALFPIAFGPQLAALLLLILFTLRGFAP